MTSKMPPKRVRPSHQKSLHRQWRWVQMWETGEISRTQGVKKGVSQNDSNFGFWGLRGCGSLNTGRGTGLGWKGVRSSIVAFLDSGTNQDEASRNTGWDQACKCGFWSHWWIDGSCSQKSEPDCSGPKESRGLSESPAHWARHSVGWGLASTAYLRLPSVCQDCLV